MKSEAIREMLKAVFGDDAVLDLSDLEEAKQRLNEPLQEAFCQCGSCAEAYEAGMRQVELLISSGHCPSWLMQVGIVMLNAGKLSAAAGFTNRMPPSEAFDAAQGHYLLIEENFAKMMAKNQKDVFVRTDNARQRRSKGG